jgi:hypothetical protein
MIPTLADWIADVAVKGFALVPAVFNPGQVDDILHDLQGAFDPHAGDSAIRSDGGIVFAARNLIQLWPAAATVWRQPPLPKLLAACLGPSFGLVRGLFFDKPPDRSWALPWHKDLTIAVREHRPSQEFVHPTVKAGVPHVEAPRQLLESMLTVRIHLDDVTHENGPLQVVPGSHRSGKEMELGNTQPETILAKRGDVLLIRPLVAHCSGGAHPETRRHRRIVHLECAACKELPEGFRWHDFLPGSRW